MACSWIIKKRLSSDEGSKESISKKPTSHGDRDGHTSIRENPENKPGMFYIDYSIKGTAKCNKCNKCIAKSELRISKPTMYKKKEIERSYHVACLFEKVRTVNNIITNVEQIIGIDMIKSDEQVLIRQLVAQMDPICEQLQARNASKMLKRVETPRKLITDRNKVNLVCLEKSSLKVLYTNADQLTSQKLSELKYKILLQKPMIVAVCEVKPKNKTAKSRHIF